MLCMSHVTGHVTGPVLCMSHVTGAVLCMSRDWSCD